MYAHEVSPGGLFPATLASARSPARRLLPLLYMYLHDVVLRDPYVVHAGMASYLIWHHLSAHITSCMASSKRKQPSQLDKRSLVGASTLSPYSRVAALISSCARQLQD
jgi:hypothetical protein